jgi:hypothetical protein
LKMCQRDLSRKWISLQNTLEATAIAAWQSLPHRIESAVTRGLCGTGIDFIWVVIGEKRAWH